MKTIWVYTFEDGTVLKVLDNGLSTEEVIHLQKLHGKATVKCRYGL